MGLSNMLGSPGRLKLNESFKRGFVRKEKKEGEVVKSAVFTHPKDPIGGFSGNLSEIMKGCHGLQRMLPWW
jgi:hypothetical protein